MTQPKEETLSIPASDLPRSHPRPHGVACDTSTPHPPNAPTHLRQLAIEREKAHNAQEQASRLESLRLSAASAARQAHSDAKKARAEADHQARALEAERERGAASRRRRAAEDAAAAAESEELQRRLAHLRGEAEVLEGRLREASRELGEREARAEAAAAAAEREEERLADCRDSFGLEVEGLQKGVGELESEAVGWRGALEAARSRLAAEEERGRTERLAVQAEVKRLGREADRRRAEVEEEEARLEGLRVRHRAEGERLAREAREATVKLETLRSEATDVRSRLAAGQAELQTASAAAEEKLASADGAEAAAVTLGRRAADLQVQVEDLEAARDRAAAAAESARRRQAEELSLWKEAMEDRRQEFERFSGLVRDKAAALSDLKEQVGKEAADRVFGSRERWGAYAR